MGDGDRRSKGRLLPDTDKIICQCQEEVCPAPSPAQPVYPRAKRKSSRRRKREVFDLNGIISHPLHSLRS